MDSQEEKKEKDIVIGIDLGTTNSEVAIIEDGKAKILRIHGSNLVPSMVSINEDGDVLVGQLASNNQLVAPENTIAHIKRKMGSDEAITLNGKEYTPPMVSSLILSELKRMAETHCGQPISKAVITVPAYFTEREREATMQAGELAGLEVLRLLNEPTAAAVAYSMGRQQEEVCLVYDFGGGTFDVSIVDLSQDILEVRASHGDTALGGADFDKLIYEDVRKAFMADHNIDLSKHSIPRVRVIQAVEKAKIKLSTEPSVVINEEFLCKKDEIDIHLKYEIDRPKFEEMIRPIIDKTLFSVRKALKDASCLVTDLDRVILVGGSTLVPMVSEVLEEELKIAPQAWLDPSTIVAQGAAIEAANLSGEKLGAMMVDITPHSLGTAAIDMYGELSNSILIRRNTPLPAIASRVFYKFDDATHLKISAYQGESQRLESCKFLGKFDLSDIPDSGRSEIVIKLELDRSGLLNVTATDVGSGIKNNKTMNRVKDSRHSKENLANLSSVRLYQFDDELDVEIDELDDNGNVIEEITTTKESQTHLLNPELETRLQAILEDDAVDAMDREELESAFKAARDGQEGAVKKLEDLLYYLA